LQNYKALLSVTTVLFLAALMTAQNSSDNVSPDTPEMPSISSPQMPKITVPSIGNSFYRPVQPPFIPTPPAKPNQPQANAPAQSQQNQTLQNTASQDNTSTALTANRLAELGALTGLSQWSSLLSDSLQPQTGNTGTDASSVNVLLQNILSQLETIQKNLPQSQTPQQSVKQSSGQILRFKVNGSDILATCRDIYFSTADSSGVFLLTGDRKFTYNQQIRGETFYFLFQPKVANAGTALYDVAVSVSAESAGIQSYLKLLSSNSPLTAFRTGNLVTIRSQENDTDIDMLIDVGNAQN
jgi:hypothetical protein